MEEWLQVGYRWMSDCRWRSAPHLQPFLHLQPLNCEFLINQYLCYQVQSFKMNQNDISVQHNCKVIIKLVMTSIHFCNVVVLLFLNCMIKLIIIKIWIIALPWWGRMPQYFTTRSCASLQAETTANFLQVCSKFSKSLLSPITMHKSLQSAKHTLPPKLIAYWSILLSSFWATELCLFQESTWAQQLLTSDVRYRSFAHWQLLHD